MTAQTITAIHDTVFVDHYCLVLMSEELPYPDANDAEDTGFLYIFPTHLIIQTEKTDAKIGIIISELDSAPEGPPEGYGRWQECTLDINTTLAPVALQDVGHDPVVFTPSKPGKYNVRVAGRTRGEQEDYLVEVWSRN